MDRRAYGVAWQVPGAGSRAKSTSPICAGAVRSVRGRQRALLVPNDGENDDPINAGGFANRICNQFGSGAGNPCTRNVRKQSGVERRQALAGAAKTSFMAKCK